MSFFERSGTYKNRLLTALLLTVFAGAMFATVTSMRPITREYLNLELYFILTNYPFLSMVGMVSITSSLALIPAIQDPSAHANGIKLALILAVGIGSMFGILKSLTFIISNKYLPFGMYYSAVQSAATIINNALVITLVAAVVALIVLLTLRALLSFLNFSGNNSKVIVSGILPSLLIFIAGGYWLNKSYFPKFFELKSIIGNILWAIVSLLLLFGLGWVLVRLSQIRLNFATGKYFIKSLVVVLFVVIIANLANYSYLQTKKKKGPNLILISLDTLRADHLGSYGYNRNATPNIDRFARDAVRFRDAIAQSSWTLPSHMSLLTGLYVSTHGVMWPVSKLHNVHLTLAEVLQDAGYETAAFTDGGYVSHKFGYQGFDRFEEGYYKELGGVETLYQKTIKWLRGNHERPFFLFLHTYQVHCPYDPPSEYDIYSDKNYHGLIQVAGNCSKYFETVKPKMKSEDYRYVIDKYDGLIYYTDHFMGKLFDELKELGVYDDSIIVLTSDHGENFSDHLAYNINHVELYDEVIKVPLIIKAPGFPRNRVLDQQVESIDIMPTVLELMGIIIPNKLDGESLVALVSKGSYDGIFAFSENWWDSPHKMIRTKDWKLLRRSENEVELFDLKNDPEEAINLLTKKPEIARPLYESLHVWMDNQEEKSKLFSTSEIRMDDRLSEQLKALGYVN